MAKFNAVLVTRPEPGARQTAALIEQMGLTAILAPALIVAPTSVALPSRRIAAILLTSGNAIAAFGPQHCNIPVLTVGDSTAAWARAHGFTNVVSADGDALDLAELAARRLQPNDGALLLASGRGQGLALAAILRKQGHRVIRRVAYAARPAPELPAHAVAALRERRIAAALFFSAETAQAFIKLLHGAGLADSVQDVVAVAIGRRAAEVLQTLSWRRIEVARKPNQDAMLAFLR